MKKKVLVLTTGGTIVSADSETGLRPQITSGQFRKYLADLDSYFTYDIHNLMNLDSSNIQAEEWQAIAHAVMESLDDYDGIVITHGTDTMAYTASALSFMLQNLHKPVVLTGSQIPISRLLTDARTNLYTAFSAVENAIPGVSIAFDHRIIRGCRAVKTRTMGFEAFESVNAPCLGELFADGMHLGRIDPVPEDRKTVLKDRLCKDVFLLKLIPGTRPEIFEALGKMKYRGIVLETFGAGGMHFLRRNLLPELKKLTDSGISVAACSQCLYDTSDFSIYEVGKRLLECGIIPARDMTTEAVVTKLMWALGQTDDPQEVVRMFRTNYAGEIRVPQE
jgi:L-asparaginase